MKITKKKRIHSLIVGMGSKSSPTLCNKWILEHETHRCERLPLSELPCLFSVREAGSVPTSACDISSEGEDRASDNSNDREWRPDEVDLNAVTIGNMSIDSKIVETGGERGRYRAITVDSGA